MYAYDYEPLRRRHQAVWIVDDDRSIRWVLEKAAGARRHPRTRRSRPRTKCCRRSR